MYLSPNSSQPTETPQIHNEDIAETLVSAIRTSDLSPYRSLNVLKSSKPKSPSLCISLPSQPTETPQMCNEDAAEHTLVSDLFFFVCTELTH